MKNLSTKASPELLARGHKKYHLELPDFIKSWTLEKNYDQLDQYFNVSLASGELAKIVKTYGEFTQREFILSLRSGPDDEDGIWHDDGSRVLAFSLGLNTMPHKIEGGELLLQKKGQPTSRQTFSPLGFGELVLFLTGVWGWEHKVNAVKSGERLVCAGWLT